MTSLIATPDNETGSVALSITKTADVTKVVRMNANGIEEVRASTGQLPSIGAGTLILTDYEGSHGLNTYNVYMGPEVRTNLSTNPSPTTGTTWSTSYGAGGAGTVSYGAVAGFPSANGSTSTFTTPPAAGWNIQTGVFSGVVGGQPITGSLYGKHSWAGGTACLTFQFFDAANVSLGYFGVEQQAIPANTVTRISQTITAPATATKAAIFWDAQGPPSTQPPVNGVVVIGAPLLEVTPVLGAYFDGSTPASTDITYAWTGTANASTSTQTILNVMITGSATLDLDKPWLSVPVMPQYSEQVDSITAFGAGREANTTVHRPLGRADSLVVMGKLGDRTGSLEVFCNSYTEARKLERIFERGEVVQLRQRVESMDMYFTVTSIPVSPYSVQGETATRWAMVLNYVEVRRPIGNLAGALGWTFTEMASSAVSFDVISQSYLTFDALTLGDANV